MQCVACGHQSSYNRAVVDTVDDTEIGVLCPNCERKQFGQALETGDWIDEVCVLCNRDGYYALPEWRAYVVEVDGKRVSRSEYSMEPPSPYLCDLHYDQLTESAPADAEQVPHSPET